MERQRTHYVELGHKARHEMAASAAAGPMDISPLVPCHQPLWVPARTRPGTRSRSREAAVLQNQR